MQTAIETYLKGIFGPMVRLLEFKRLGAGVHGAGFLVKIDTGTGEKTFVLKDLSSEGLGHDYPSDRAGVFLLALETYGTLPNHIRAVDVISLQNDGALKSIGGGKEYYLLMEKGEGRDYFTDLHGFSRKEKLEGPDIDKIKVMTSYLAGIHSVRKDSKTLYWRKLRDTVGHGECLMGVFDTYPEDTVHPTDMVQIIKKSVDSIYRLRPKHARLSQIHGDFHPGNIWFTNNQDFTLLDRSRGPWGDPADDITALTINFIFFSIKYYGTVKGPYLEGLKLFFDDYVRQAGDQELCSVVQPFFAFRGAVVANPIFYPELTRQQRQTIFTFINNVLDSERFDADRVNDYIG